MVWITCMVRVGLSSSKMFFAGVLWVRRAFFNIPTILSTSHISWTEENMLMSNKFSISGAHGGNANYRTPLITSPLWRLCGNFTACLTFLLRLHWSTHKPSWPHLCVVAKAITGDCSWYALMRGLGTIDIKDHTTASNTHPQTGNVEVIGRATIWQHQHLQGEMSVRSGWLTVTSPAI